MDNLTCSQRFQGGDGDPMKNVRMAILSATGTARKRTIPAVREGGICEIVGIQGRDESKLAALAKQYSIRYHSSDPLQLLDQAQPDVVFIASPPMMHRAQIETCIARKIPVLCEKPLVLHSAEASSLQTLIRSSSVPFAVAHHLRHQSGVAMLRNMITAGGLGDLRRVSMQWGFWLKSDAPNAQWKLNPESGGPDAFYDVGIHAIDLLLYLLPPPTEVAAISRRSRFCMTRDNVSALVLCGSTIVEMNASQSLRFSGNALSLDFEQGTVHVPNAFSESAFAEMKIVTSSGVTVNAFEKANLYAEEVRDFISLIEGKQARGTTIEEACQAIQILEAITLSYKTGRTVSLTAEMER
jgi:1,5-anhydro-D-fructose reductase (1,5-anhydro-D-mannitol-forming)